MKRRVLSVLLCAGLVVSVLAGCGSDDAKKDSGKKAASESDLDYVKEKERLSWESQILSRWITRMKKANGSVLMRIWRRRSERASA